MSIRVAHLSGLWKAGATAMVRIHDGLRAEGIESRLHSASPVDDTLSNAFTVPPIIATRRQKLARKWRRDATDWRRRIEQAAKSNTDFECFSPPVALTPHDLSAVTDEIDVLHLHWVGSYFDFRDFFPQLQVPVVWTLHDQNPYLGGFHYQSDVDAATSMLPLEYECRDLKRGSLAGTRLTVVGNSDWNAGAAMSTGVFPSHTSVERIYLPLPTDRYIPHCKADCKAKLGIDRQRFVVGFACAAMGNRRKGFVDLVAAIERLPASVRDKTTLVSFGFQPTKEIRRRVSVPWIHQGRPSGGVEQSPIYSAMDVFVIPSLEEAFGQTALESLACQTPVIGTRVGGIPEIVGEEVTGLLAPPRCPQRLAQCIERFFADASLRVECGIRGRKLALERHEPRIIAKAYVDLYRRITSQEQQRTAASVARAA